MESHSLRKLHTSIYAGVEMKITQFNQPLWSHMEYILNIYKNLRKS